MSPGSLIRAATEAHPAFKYSIVVAGLAAIVATVTRFGISAVSLVFGVIILVFLMVTFLLFARATSLATRSMTLPALVLVWGGLALSLLTATLLFTSAFFDFPLPLREAITHQIPRADLPRPRSNGQIQSLYSEASMHARIALVVGNSMYRGQFLKLESADPDAQAVARKLKLKGFRVALLLDPSSQTLAVSIRAFSSALVLGGVGVLYYAGQGFRASGSDYIIPTDFGRARGLPEIVKQSVSVTQFLGSTPVVPGFTPASSGEVIIYSAAQGQPAADNFEGGGGHSPFADAVLKSLDQPSGDLFDFVRFVTERTEDNTDARQVPWLLSSFTKRFDFNDPSEDSDIGILKILLFDSSTGSLNADTVMDNTDANALR
jgi:Caspase domain